MKVPAVVAALCVVVGLCVGSGICARSGQDGGSGGFSIYVAPSTLVKGAPCPWVTVHTDVAYGAVDAASAEVDGSGVKIASTMADSRGNIVLKIRFDDVAELVAPPSATVTVTLVVDGEARVASETIVVRD